MISEQMDCKEIRDRLMDLLCGELSKGEEKRFLTHLSTCSVCSKEKENLERAWKGIDSLGEVQVPKDLRDATISRIEAMIQAEKPDRLWVKMRWKGAALRPLTAVFGGVAMAFLSLWVLQRVTAFELISGDVIFLCSVLWTGILAGTFLLATDSLSVNYPKWAWASRIALVSLGLTMLGTAFCPKMSLIRWWEGLPPGEFLLGFGQGISQGAFGLLYALFPFLLAICLQVKSARGQFLPWALSAGILFLILLLPVIYLQAFPLSPGVFLNWFVGSTFGVLVVALSGVGIYRLRSGSPAVV